jgi:hypothetical protein
MNVMHCCQLRKQAWGIMLHQTQHFAVCTSVLCLSSVAIHQFANNALTGIYIDISRLFNKFLDVYDPEHLSPSP